MSERDARTVRRRAERFWDGVLRGRDRQKVSVESIQEQIMKLDKEMEDLKDVTVCPEVPADKNEETKHFAYHKIVRYLDDIEWEVSVVSKLYGWAQNQQSGDITQEAWFTWANEHSRMFLY